MGELGTRLLGSFDTALRSQEIIHQIQQVQAPNDSAGHDRTLWKQNPDGFESKFSSKRTWNLLRVQGSVVAWHRLVWFPQAIPRQAFISWLAFCDRLSTCDRTRKWGIHQPCPLCGEQNETRNHLFLACPYSHTVWTIIASGLLGSRINPDWTRTVNSLLWNRLSSLDNSLDCMAFQSTIYWLWRERNGRIHYKPHHSAFFTAHTIHKEMQTRLLAHDGEDENEWEGLARWNSISRI